jgi:hypothetical protein
MLRSESGRSRQFHEWLEQQPPSVVAQISRKEREYNATIQGRAPVEAYADSLEGWSVKPAGFRGGFNDNPNGIDDTQSGFGHVMYGDLMAIR